VAQLAGGHWPHLVAAACSTLLSGQQDEDLSTLLLTHVRDVFDGADVTDEDGKAIGPRVDKMWSCDLVERLCAREDWPWDSLKAGPLSASGLAKRLKDFRIEPKTLRVEGQSGTKRGYERASFDDAWNRFITAPSVDATPATPATDQLSALHPVAPVAVETGEGESVGATTQQECNALTSDVAPVAPVAADHGEPKAPRSTCTRCQRPTKAYFGPERLCRDCFTDDDCNNDNPRSDDPAEQWYGDDPGVSDPAPRRKRPTL
jgi:hypothetical protein